MGRPKALTCKICLLPRDPKARRALCTECNREAWRNESRKYKYGITVEQYESMCDQQDGRCASCGAEEPLVIDHNHLTGMVRGLLCQGCNKAAGFLGDNPGRAAQLSNYLSSFSNLRECNVETSETCSKIDPQTTETESLVTRKSENGHRSAESQSQATGRGKAEEPQVEAEDQAHGQAPAAHP